jgi:xanthine dehydrogenase accessory factor
MEHKLVELAKSVMASGEPAGILKRQLHREGEAKDRSGMICSGEQTVAFTLLLPLHTAMIHNIVDGLMRDRVSVIRITSDGLLMDEEELAIDREWSPAADDSWYYRERLGPPPRLLIIGGGHVGLALSRTMKQLGFHVRIVDDRPDLNTMANNTWADQSEVVAYDRIAEMVNEDGDLYIALVSHGYRTDGVAIRQLVRRRYKYLGMLGSEEKVRKMFEEMRGEGFTEAELARVHAPIGVPIHSRTPDEIAVSIAAEIIQVKNRSTGS